MEEIVRSILITYSSIGLLLTYICADLLHFGLGFLQIKQQFYKFDQSKSRKGARTCIVWEMGSLLHEIISVRLFCASIEPCPAISDTFCTLSFIPFALRTKFEWFMRARELTPYPLTAR